ncbi:MAG: hypothetical protein LBV58_01160 [Acholeplasmatales bacterium]|jgi:hypothetical protein|nr:hypothetical protein [Acholeplasmatales bacterium]
MKKLLIVVILILINLSLFSCDSLDKVKDVDDKLSPELTPHLKKENPYSGKVFLDLIVNVKSKVYIDYSKVISSEVELYVFSLQHEVLKKSKIVFEDFDFSEGNLLFLFVRQALAHGEDDFTFESLEVSDGHVDINIKLSFEFAGYAFTSYLFIFNVPKEVNDTYSISHTLIGVLG